jgi:hypothetical protein
MARFVVVLNTGCLELRQADKEPRLPLLYLFPISDAIAGGKATKVRGVTSITMALNALPYGGSGEGRAGDDEKGKSKEFHLVISIARMR